MPFIVMLVTLMAIPLQAATIDFQVNFLTLGGQSCAFNFCNEVAAGTLETGFFTLDEPQLTDGGIFDITLTSDFPRISRVPATGTGSALFFAVVANQTVEDILIGVEWVNYVLEFGNNYAFVASAGEWAHSSTTSGGGLNINYSRFGIYAIEEFASDELQTVPEPGSWISMLSGLALVLTARSLRAQPLV